MLFRSMSRTRGMLVLFIPAILAFLLLRPTLIGPPNSASNADSAAGDHAHSSIHAAVPATDGDSPGASVTDALSTTNGLSVTARGSRSLVAPSPTATVTSQRNNYIWIPWRSQFDGSPYASANCGPASLGMAMSYYGEWWSTDGIRKSTNALLGAVPRNEGTDWPSLKYAAETRDFTVVGLYDSSGGYRKWTVDQLVREIEQERPVLLLVRQRSLPGHEDTRNYSDHYIVFLGLMSDGRVVYHDSAFAEELQGAYRLMSQEALLKAWSDTWAGLQFTAMSLVWEHESRKWDAPTSAAALATPAVR